MESIKELDEIFTKGTKTYTQIGKNDNAYLYEVTDSDPNSTTYQSQRKNYLICWTLTLNL